RGGPARGPWRRPVALPPAGAGDRLAAGGGVGAAGVARLARPALPAGHVLERQPAAPGARGGSARGGSLSARPGAAAAELPAGGGTVPLQRRLPPAAAGARP